MAALISAHWSLKVEAIIMNPGCFSLRKGMRVCNIAYPDELDSKHREDRPKKIEWAP